MPCPALLAGQNRRTCTDPTDMPVRARALARWQALAIYRLYQQLRAQNEFEQVLQDVYECGRAFNWTPSAANLGATYRPSQAAAAGGNVAT